MNNKDSSALIIFVRNPILGKVKTRLAKDIGDEKALEIYKLLLKHTFDVTKDLNCHKFVYYDHKIEHNDIWDEAIFSKCAQMGDDLGMRMYNAMNECFEKGFKKVLIIGSDCLELTKAILDEAISQLDQKDSVIGPTTDGGYYLLGLKKLIPELFLNKIWSSNHVFESSLIDLKKQVKSFHILPELNDIDDASDLIIWNSGY